MQLSLLSVNLTVFILVACAIESDSFDDVSILSNSNEKPGLTSSDASDGDYESNFDLSFDKDSSCPEKFDRLVDNRRVRRGKSICPSRKPSNSNVNNKPQPVNPTTHGKPVTDETPLMPLERNNEICSFGDMIGPGQVGPGYLVCDSGVPEDRDGQSYLYNSAYVDTLRNCRQCTQSRQ